MPITITASASNKAAVEDIGEADEIPEGKAVGDVKRQQWLEVATIQKVVV